MPAQGNMALRAATEANTTMAADLAKLNSSQAKLAHQNLINQTLIAMDGGGKSQCQCLRQGV